MTISKAPRRLYLMQVATGTVPLPAGGSLIWPVVCYLVETGDGKRVLIDTGHPPDFEPPFGAPPLERGKNVIVQLVVQRSHYEVARNGHPRYAAGRGHWDHPSLRYRLVEGDTELVPGLIVLETSGHAPGHQSVLVQLPKTGPVLLTIDAVVLERMFIAERRATPVDDNETELRASTQRLLDVVTREQVSLVIFGHDGEQWLTLNTSPAFYD